MGVEVSHNDVDIMEVKKLKIWKLKTAPIRGERVLPIRGGIKMGEGIRWLGGFPLGGERKVKQYLFPQYTHTLYKYLTIV